MLSTAIPILYTRARRENEKLAYVRLFYNRSLIDSASPEHIGRGSNFIVKFILQQPFFNSCFLLSKVDNVVIFIA